MKNFNIYRAKILLLGNSYKNSEFTVCEECLEFHSYYNECQLQISINSRTNIIESISVTCDDKNIQLLMNVFCSIIHKIPILEASDHGVIRLENTLRDHSKYPVMGVIMPENSCNYFQVPLNLIRDIFDQFCEKTSYHPIVNTYISDKIQEWKILEKDTKEKIICEKIDFFCEQHNIEDYHVVLISDTRVEFSIDKTKLDSLAKFLFDMEQILNREFAFPIEVMFTEKKDINKKRQNKMKGAIDE